MSIKFKISMNVAVMSAAMGLVLTCQAPSLVPALLAIPSTLMSDNVLVRINAIHHSVESYNIIVFIRLSVIFWHALTTIS